MTSDPSRVVPPPLLIHDLLNPRLGIPLKCSNPIPVAALKALLVENGFDFLCCRQLVWELMATAQTLLQWTVPSMSRLSRPHLHTSQPWNEPLATWEP